MQTKGIQYCPLYPFLLQCGLNVNAYCMDVISEYEIVFSKKKNESYLKSCHIFYSNYTECDHVIVL